MTSDASEPTAPSRFFATAARGTAEVLAAELAAAGLSVGETVAGGVAFGERLDEAYRACMWSRVASRILMPLARFEAENADELYAGVHAVDWTDHVGPERTLAVSVAGDRSPVGPSHFVALKTKDAIVDRVREREGARPNIDKLTPDVRVHVHTEGVSVTVSLDLSGTGLHHRGLGREGLAAPLKENLAAAVLRLAGWPEQTSLPLLDPLCGSGTLLVEAAAMARDVAPGLARGRLGAQGWRAHDAALWKALAEEARERLAAAARRPLRIAGCDASSAAIDAARATLERARLADAVELAVGELRDAQPPWTEAGLIVTNPPYGARLGEAGELGPLYELLGDVLRRRFPGWTAWVLSGNRALEKRIGLRPATRLPLFNGPIDCRLLSFPIDAAPAASADGPAWRRPSSDAAGFARKLRANAERFGAWAAREGLDCYRVYDGDVSTYPLAVDRYAGAVRIEEQSRPRSVDAATADRRLAEAVRCVAEVLEVDPADVALRVRRRLGRHEQHGRYADHGRSFDVKEGKLRFSVNLTDHVDTGLFLHDRLVRRWLRARAAGLDVLNLFAYTCAASVAAAAGGARSTTSVDLSNSYLAWGRRNFELNGLSAPRHSFIREDALRLLATSKGPRYGLVFVAPPSRSRSKGMAGDFDVARDHARLLRLSAERLTPAGAILFATSLREFELASGELGGLSARELTEELTPHDFARRPRQRIWLLERSR